MISTVFCDGSAVEPSGRLTLYLCRNVTRNMKNSTLARLSPRQLRRPDELGRKSAQKFINEASETFNGYECVKLAAILLETGETETFHQVK